MPIPPQICPPPPHTPRRQARHERILKVAEYLLAEHGRHDITFAGLASALTITPTALRTHFADMEALHGELLRISRHRVASETENIHAKEGLLF